MGNLKGGHLSAVSMAFFLRPLVHRRWETVRRRLDLEYGYLLNYPELNPPLIAQQMLVSGEDHRHALHPGFDPISICRAIWRRFFEGKREGASTIEQQIVRTILEDHRYSIRRKVVEIILSTIVSATYPKKTLPIIYLSMGYYGWRMSGYKQACRRLKLHSDHLTIMEAASLVARLKYPQPRVASIRRIRQIISRARHLIRLHSRHTLNGTYGYLNDGSI